MTLLLAITSGILGFYIGKLYTLNKVNKMIEDINNDHK